MPFDLRDAAALQGPAAGLHRRILAAARAERERHITDDDVDETGRAWRGLVSTEHPTPNQEERR